MDKSSLPLFYRKQGVNILYEYQIVLDIWEGNPNLDVNVLKSNGVTGLIVRINDMSGGSHMDKMFAQSWELAKQFPVSAIYFVYNPWVSGTENFNWLYNHLPGNYKQRLFVDIEVSMAGYPFATYANEVQTFCNLCKNKFPVSIYTGEWFLHMLSYWPKELDYWWAAYPSIFWPIPSQAISWDEFRQRLTTVAFAYNKASCPGSVILWQCSGDQIKLPGGNGHPVDVNIFQGNLNNLENWFNMPIDNSIPIPQPNPIPPVPVILQTARTTAFLGLRIRDLPDISGNRIGSLPLNSIVNIYEIKNNWARIDAFQSLWVSMDYLK